MNKKNFHPDIAMHDIEGLSSATVSVRARTIDDYFDYLHPEEKQFVKKAVQKRRNEFSTGRFCAHEAMKSLGIQTEKLLPGHKRQPLWPESIIGSISHSGDCGIAVVSTDKRLISLGIDVEVREGIKPGVRDLVCSPEEIKGLGDYAQDPEYWKLIFSVKESLYKCLFPVLEQWIGFSQARVVFDFEHSSFTADMDAALPLDSHHRRSLRGRYLMTDRFILSCAEITRSD